MRKPSDEDLAVLLPERQHLDVAARPAMTVSGSPAEMRFWLRIGG